jgi:putative acetyltransferase
VRDLHRGPQAGRTACSRPGKDRTSSTIIRSETPADRDAITEVTIAAFKDHPYSRQTEHVIVEALRRAGAIAVSLVAELDGQIVGHIAFSPVTISDGTRNWYGAGPLSVLPAHQKHGIGSALVREGLAVLKERGARGCALVGDPAYYRRFGFTNDPDLIHDGIPQEVFLVLNFGQERPRGKVVFHEGFTSTA